ncbi:transglutaminase domain-containing protein [Streptomyces sp. NPDC051018]|uniref:transglutaminase domain-containing protein n=1 Tax=Streptomyces sp. NPDC051018 TaxID=3365639 RepID=UPI003791B0BA
MTATAAGLPAASDALIGALMADVARIPDEHRTYTCGTWEARTQHGIGAELLDRLTRAGLSSREVDGEPHFDGLDLGNLALHLGLSSVQRVAIRSWGRTWARVRRGPGRHVLRYVPACPEPGHEGPCHYRFVLPGGRRHELTLGPLDEPPAVTLESTPPPPAPRLPDDLAALCHEIAALRFFLLAESIRWDADFMRSCGIADCGGSSTLLLEGAQRLGYVARRSFGLIVAEPFSTPHHWADIRLDGTWVPFDPMIMKALARWSSAVPDDTPVTQPLTGLVARISGEWLPPAVHGDGDTQPRISYLTEYHAHGSTT